VSHLRRDFWQPSPLLLVVPLVLTVAAYARVLGGGFVFDDPGSVHDATVKDLAAQARLFLHALFHSGRPVVDLSLALNYAAGGLDAMGYHAANIAIHLATVFVVFAFTARTLELAGIARARGLALAVAGVFGLHPLQSEAVSYVSQRAESLASAFYLIALLLLLATERAPSTAWRVLFWAGAYGAFLFGLGTKPILITMPLAYLLLATAVPERRTLRASCPRRLAMLAPFVATAGWHIHQLLGSVQGLRHVGAAVQGMTAWTYFLTQWKVLLVYLRLIFWPAGQCLDWHYPVTTHVGAGTVVAGAMLAVMGGGGVTLLWRFRGKSGEAAAAARISGFGVLWFFLILAPTSSVVPIADVLVEHRVYLASWGIFTAVVMILGRILQRLREEHRGMVAISLLGVLWGTLAMGLYRRNRVWQDPITLWTDVVAKMPGDARDRVLLAGAYQDRGDLDRAAAEYEMALRVVADTDSYWERQARLGLGASLVDLGRIDDGIAVIEGGLAHDPANAEILASLSEAWWHRGDQSRAESLAERALAKKPGLGGPLLVLGAARKVRGDLEGAVSSLARATKAYPDWAMARLNLADVYAQLGRRAEACAAWRTVLHSATAVPEERERALSEASAAGCAKR
jgi:Tfp pilus assembly protein PilF